MRDRIRLDYTTWVSAMEAYRRARNQKPHALLWWNLRGFISGFPPVMHH